MQNGYSLAEMIVVLSIMALVCVCIATAFGNHGELPNRALAQQVHNKLTDAAQKSRSSGLPIRLTFNDPKIAIIGANNRRKSEIVFWPDGTSSGGRLSINNSQFLQVDPLFGNVSAQ